MKFFFKIISSKIAFFIVTSAIILSLNLTPLVTFILHSPPGRTFAMIHNNAQDFFFYQSLMNEGANGAWLTSDPYTSEPHQSSIIFSYFLWLGKLSKILGLPYIITYHLTRIILSILSLFTIYYLLFTINIPYPRLAYLFFLFSAPLMHTISEGEKIVSIPYMNWWTGMDPIRRVAYLPHHMVGSLLLVTTLLLVIKHLRQNSKCKIQKSPNNLLCKFSEQAKLQLKIQNYKYLLYAILLAPILAFIHTPSLLILLLILPPAVGLQIALRHLGGGRLSLRSHDSPEVEKSVIGLFVYWVIGLLFLILMVSQTNQGFPWSQYIDWEKKLQFPLDKELIGAMGILFPFSIIGAWQTVKSKKFEYILITCWLLVPFLFIPIAPKLNLSNIRLIQGIPYLPLAILSILGIYSLENIFIQLKSLLLKSKIKNQKSKIQLKVQDLLSFVKPKSDKDTSGVILSEAKGSPDGGGIRNLVLLLSLIIFSFSTYPTLSWSLKDQIREYWPIFGNVYLDNRLNNAFAFINQNFPPKTVTLSTFYTGNYLPAFTHTITYLGHFGYTYNVDKKQADSFKFFKNQMLEEEAKDFLTNNKINLIWQGPEEKPIYKDYLYPTVLKPVYDKEEVTIYNLK